MIKRLRQLRSLLAFLDELALGRPIFQDKAKAGIEGMFTQQGGGSEESDTVIRWEKVYQQLVQKLPESTQPIEDFKTLHAIARDQVGILALVYQKALNDLAAARAMVSRHDDFMKLMGEPRDFQVWLQERFPSEWTNKPPTESFTDFAKRMMGNR